MRIYGSVQIQFWENQEIQRLSDQAKLLAIYLLTAPHSNMLGCFRIPEGYIREDLNWCHATVKNAINALKNIEFITHDTKNSWVVIHDFLKWNPIQNPKQAIGIQKIFFLVPKESIVFKPLVKGLLKYAKYLNEEFKDSLFDIDNDINTVTQDCATDKEQNKNQNKDQNIISLSGKPDVVNLDENNLNENETSSIKDQAIQVLNFLNEKTGKAYRPVDANIKLIIARLKSGATVMDCRQVIANKFRKWCSDEKMVEYLRPATLFNATKFEQYMGELSEPEEVPHDE